jgi:hypothetical protein
MQPLRITESLLPCCRSHEYGSPPQKLDDIPESIHSLLNSEGRCRNGPRNHSRSFEGKSEIPLARRMLPDHPAMLYSRPYQWSVRPELRSSNPACPPLTCLACDVFRQHSTGQRSKISWIQPQSPSHPGHLTTPRVCTLNY